MEPPSDDALFDLPGQRMIVVAPHADDEVLGAGGLMARASRAGWEVKTLFATISGFPSQDRGDTSTTDARRSEVEAALEILGAPDYEALFLGEEKHLRLDTVAQSELIGFIEGAVARMRPSIVVLPCRGHYHQDHRAVAEAGTAALRPAPDGPRPRVPVVLAYGHSAAGWGGDLFAFHPNTFVDISHVLETKLAALAAYASQLCPSPHPRSLEGVRSFSATWGGYAGVAHAEPFETLRWLI